MTPIHQPPVVTNVAVSTNEDTTLTFAAGNFTPGSYSDPNGDPIASVIVTSLPANGVLKNGATTLTTTPVAIGIANVGNLTYVPNGNYNGADSFTWNASDGTLTALAVATVNLTVNSVNDVPSFTKGADQTVLEDAAAQTVNGWATALSAGPANEAGQVLNFIVGNNNPALFSLQPAIAANGTLTYTPAANANGGATVTVQIHDNGGVANSGVDTSVAQTFTITVTAVNDPPVITGQNSIFTTVNTPRTVLLGELLVTDVDNPYPTGFSVTVGNGTNYTNFGNAIIPAAEFRGTLTVPVTVSDGAANSNSFNLLVPVYSSFNTIAPFGAGGFKIDFQGNANANYTVQYANAFLPLPTAWQLLGIKSSTATGTFTITDTPPANTPMRFYRAVLPYTNDFGSGIGAVTLRGSAVWASQAVMLTDIIAGQTGAVVFEGMPAGPSLSGFTAKFNANISLPGGGTPADGISFAVGDLGAVAWGETGPATASNLTVGFDTFDNGGTGTIGIHVWVNGTHLGANATNPFTGGATFPVEISYGVATGVTVKFNGATVISNLGTPGFAFPAGGKFGIGARTGGSVERAVVDDVEITPR